MLNKHQSIRVRFAPSPTGYLHVGSVRTAIFNFLFALKNQGKFLLRIEDTDRERSSDEWVEQIYETLQWLNLEWNDQPFVQSDRLSTYLEKANQLVEENKAYRCYCTVETLQKKREKARREKSDYRYDGTCRNLTDDKKKTYDTEKRPFVIRFKCPEGETAFDDLVHGSLIFQHSELDDFILIRSDGTPVYQLAVVVDDHDMKITHVLRGDDHISNTPKQILIFQALGWDVPIYGHFPLILGIDGKRLSKRHGASSVEEYRAQGFFADTLFNFLVLLGWSPGDDREIMDREMILREFEVKNISAKSAVFDEQKLRWMNGQYLKKLPNEKIVQWLIPKLIERHLIEESEIEDQKEYISDVVAILKERMRVLTDFITWGVYFFRDPDKYDEKGLKKHWKKPEVNQWLIALISQLEELSLFDQENIETTVRSTAERLGISAAKIIHPARIALTGFSVSPGLFEIMEILGKTKVISRLKKAVDAIQI